MLVGRIGRPHGLHGYVVVHPETDNPDRFAPGRVLLTDRGPMTVERRQGQPPSLLVRFDSTPDRTAAEALVGLELFIDASERRALEPDEFWPDELVGLLAVSPGGLPLGTITEVVEGAAQHRLVVDGPSGPFEVPFVAELVPAVDLAARLVTIADLPGLVPEP